MATPITLRPATEADQPRIVEIVREADIFPLGLKWQRFLVAEADGGIVGIGQVKTHLWGAKELASIAVIPERQKEGIASRIIHALLEREKGAIYLDCHISRETFYTRFGFRRVEWNEAPFDIKRMKLFLLLIAPLAHVMTKGNFQILVMGRP